MEIIPLAVLLHRLGIHSQVVAFSDYGTFQTLIPAEFTQIHSRKPITTQRTWTMSLASHSMQLLWRLGWAGTFSPGQIRCPFGWIREITIPLTTLHYFLRKPSSKSKSQWSISVILPVLFKESIVPQCSWPNIIRSCLAVLWISDSLRSWNLRQNYREILFFFLLRPSRVSYNKIFGNGAAIQV